MRRVLLMSLAVAVPLSACGGAGEEAATTVPAVTTSSMTSTTSTSTTTFPLEEQALCGLPPELCRTGTLVSVMVSEEEGEGPMVAFAAPAGTPLLAPTHGGFVIQRPLEVPPGSGSSTELLIFTPRPGGELVAGDTIFFFFADDLLENLQEDASPTMLAGDAISLITEGEVIPGYNLLVTVVPVGRSLQEEGTLQEILATLEEIYGVTP